MILLTVMELLTANLVIGEVPCQHWPCRCVNNFRVNCSHSMLDEIPSTVVQDTDMLVLDASSNRLSSLHAMPNQLRVLFLANNVIKTLDKSHLRMLHALIFLHLDNNDISAIHPQTLSENKRIEIVTLSGNQIQVSEQRSFLNVPGLRVLDISNCSLRSISGAMFADLPQLEELRLSHNRIQSVEEGTFQHVKLLRNLLLRKNLVNKIQKGAFTSLAKLQVLDLSDNYLSFLDEPELFSPLATLRHLDLSGNGLKYLHQSIFTKLSSLNVLYLNRNLFNELHDKLFYGLRELVTLDLSDNNLQTLPRHTMFCENKKLSYLKLTNNFMTCDNCSVWNFWKWKGKRAFFVTCNGTDIDHLFDTHHTLVNCSLIPECEPISSIKEPEPSSFLLYVYVITSVICLLFLLSAGLLSIILFRRYFRSKGKKTISVATVSCVGDQFTAKPEDPYVSEELRKRQELHRKMEEERLKLQRELYFQHQKSLKRQQQLRYRQTLERTRQQSVLEPEASRLPSVADDEREWCRADTLPVKDKYKYLTNNKKKRPETRRYSAGEPYIEDDYWHANKTRKTSKSSDGLVTDITFTVPVPVQSSVIT